jgi:hypothetical protein
MASEARPATEWSRRLLLQRLAQCSALFIAAATARVPSASADYTPQSAKRAFDRYASRILSGGELLSELDADLKAGRVGADERWNLQDGRSDAARLLRAMRIYAGVFSNNYESPKTRQLRALVDELERTCQQARTSKDATRQAQYLQTARRCYERYLEESNLASVVLATPPSPPVE